MAEKRQGSGKRAIHRPSKPPPNSTLPQRIAQRAPHAAASKPSDSPITVYGDAQTYAHTARRRDATRGRADCGFRSMQSSLHHGAAAREQETPDVAPAPPRRRVRLASGTRDPPHCAGGGR
jgi:hypothetical protein